ncbi:hypothetical protein FJ934_27270 [Mesorhizobium sp. B2-4-12]|uniref:hypothetical protein n=1 Tax=unclassified Mesorhizobium TaxID=325217 RepID=UPI00112A70C1|nr:MULTISPECIES: hypothetical protein [unclassified Mesorhizobium]TPK85364.1 hypothetical protein FJ934_27270 [Mesorhizobium sp. B2-4-12]TPK97581.1 hypothetical protein FJ938_26350 [Mesorhizobium sp. B2-4-14]
MQHAGATSLPDLTCASDGYIVAGQLIRAKLMPVLFSEDFYIAINICFHHGPTAFVGYNYRKLALQLALNFVLCHGDQHSDCVYSGLKRTDVMGALGVGKMGFAVPDIEKKQWHFASALNNKPLVKAGFCILLTAA